MERLIFFSIWVFFHEHSQFTGKQVKGQAISLTPVYDFHPLHRHIDIISRIIIAESAPLHIPSSWTRTREPFVSEGKLLTTKLCASSENISWSYLLSTICEFDVIRGKHCMKKFCESLRKHAINFEKKNMMSLTNKKLESYGSQDICHICKK